MHLNAIARAVIDKKDIAELSTGIAAIGIFRVDPDFGSPTLPSLTHAKQTSPARHFERLANLISCAAWIAERGPNLLPDEWLVDLLIGQSST